MKLNLIKYLKNKAHKANRINKQYAQARNAKS